MDIPLKAKVYCTDGECGESTRVIVESDTKQVTHVVVKEKQSPNAERIIPLDWVVDTDSDSIHVSGTSEELKKMDEFVERRFTAVSVPALSPGSGMYMPLDRSVPTMTDVDLVHSDEERLRAGQVTLERGAKVEATDGRVGIVDEFVVDPNDKTVSHLVMQKGHLWGKREVSIPMSDIDRVEKDVVYLKLSKYEIEALPDLSTDQKQ